MSVDYGNLMSAIIDFAVAPFHTYLAWTVETNDPLYASAWSVAWSFNFSALIGVLTWWKHDNTALRYFCPLSNACSLCFMNYVHWPCIDSCGIVEQLLFVLMCIQANFTVPMRVQLVQTIFVFASGLAILYHNPFIEVMDGLPLLLGATVTCLSMIGAGMYYTRFVDPTKRHGPADIISAVMMVKVARIALAVVFVQHVSKEVWRIADQPRYSQEGSMAILKASFFAVISIVAAGVFSDVSDANSSLEVEVARRTQQIRRQAEKLRMVELALQASDTAVAIVNTSHRIVWFNPALEKLASSTAEVEGAALIDTLMLTKEDAQQLQDALARRERCTHFIAGISVGARILNVEVSPFLQQQSPDITSAHYSPEESGGEENDEKVSPRFVVVFRDVTEERARERAELAAERKALHVKAMTESIEVVSHELRTPMQCTMGMTSMLLQDSTLSDDLADSLSLVMASSGLLLTLVNNMLDVRKVDANMMTEFKLKSIDSAPPIKDAVDFCRPLARSSSVELSMDLARDAVVLSDPLRQQQILINLISNAIKHTPSGNSICIRTEVCSSQQLGEFVSSSLVAGEAPESQSGPAEDNGTAVSPTDRCLVVSVSDGGSGIPTGQEKKLFRKFSQLDSETKNVLGGNTVGQPSGTGIGLNLCLKFVHIMHGNIWVNNNRDGDNSAPGCTFSFSLPLVSVDNSVNKDSIGTAEAMPFSPSRRSLVRGKCSRASKHRVLLVDDTLLNRKVFDRMLKMIGVGFVQTAESGHSALELLEREDFDLVFTDIQMPTMSGIDLSREIRSKLKPAPVVVGLTADTSVDLRERCEASGMADVLQKPITMPEMYDYFEKSVDALVLRGRKVPVEAI